MTTELLPNKKLGRKPSKARDLQRALFMPKYWRALPPPPSACDHTRGFTDWGMAGNDQWGDCVVAGSAHEVQAWTVADSGVAVTIPDANVLSVYHALSPDDSGLEIAAFLKWMQKHGLVDATGNLHAIGPYGGVDPVNVEQVRQAIYLFGCVKLGIDLPRDWYNNSEAGFRWDATKAVVVGGHDVELVSYDANGFGVVTWGVKGTITAAGLAQRCSEAWVILAPDWYAAGKSPTGLDAEALTADLAEVTGTQPPVPVDPPTPPDPPGPQPHGPCRRGVRAGIHITRGILAAARELGVAVDDFALDPKA